MGMDRTHDAGSGDGGARLASWGWHLPLRITRWADRATDDDAGQPHRDIHRTAVGDAADGDVHNAAVVDTSSNTHTDTSLPGGYERTVCAALADRDIYTTSDTLAEPNTRTMRHAKRTRQDAEAVHQVAGKH